MGWNWGGELTPLPNPSFFCVPPKLECGKRMPECFPAARTLGEFVDCVHCLWAKKNLDGGDIRTNKGKKGTKGKCRMEEKAGRSPRGQNTTSWICWMEIMNY